MANYSSSTHGVIKAMETCANTTVGTSPFWAALWTPGHSTVLGDFLSWFEHRVYMFKKRKVEAEESDWPCSHRSEGWVPREAEAPLWDLFPESAATLEEEFTWPGTEELFSAFPASQTSEHPFRGCLAQSSWENGHFKAAPRHLQFSILAGCHCPCGLSAGWGRAGRKTLAL